MIILLLLFGLLCYDFFVFPHYFLAGSLVVRESRHRRDRIFDTKTAEKEDFLGGGLSFFFQKSC